MAEGRLSTIDGIDGEVGIFVKNFEMKPLNILYGKSETNHLSLLVVMIFLIFGHDTHLGHYLHFPIIHEILDEFFGNLYAIQKENCFLPLLLPVQTLHRLRNEFVHYHRSITGIGAQLKMVLSHHFARRGTCVRSFC